MLNVSYKLISVKCPDCGKTLSIEENRTQAFCSYCGAKVLLNNENEYIFRQVDEAKIKKAETERLTLEILHGDLPLIHRYIHL